MLARLVNFIAGTTRIASANFLNPIQDEVIALYAGTKSLASLLVDGTGDNASAVAAGFASILKGLLVPGGADGDVVIDVTTAPTTWRVVLRIKTGASTYARLGVTSSGTVILSSNADYSVANSRWERDAAGYAMAIYLHTASDGPQFLWFDASSTAHWTSWNVGVRTTFTAAAGNIVASTGDLIASAGNLLASSGYLLLGGTLSSGTVGAGQALTLGRAYKDTLPIAAAYITNAGAMSNAFVWGFNIASKNHPGTGAMEVVLTNAPTNVVVNVTLRGASPNGFAGADWDAGAKKITVLTYNDAGVLADSDFNLVVFGG